MMRSRTMLWAAVWQQIDAIVFLVHHEMRGPDFWKIDAKMIQIWSLKIDQILYFSSSNTVSWFYFSSSNNYIDSILGWAEGGRRKMTSSDEETED